MYPSKRAPDEVQRTLAWARIPTSPLPKERCRQFPSGLWAEAATIGCSPANLGLFLQETCQYLKNYLTQWLVPYVVNVSWATQYCSWTQCHGHGRCVRRNPSANTFLHLSASSFRLVPGHTPNEPQLRPEGKLSDADLNYLQTHFRCQCYLGWGGEQCQRDHKREAGSARRAWAGPHLIGLLALVAMALT